MKRTDKKSKTGGFNFGSAVAPPSLAPPGPITSDPPEADTTQSDATPDPNQSVACPSFQDSPWRQVDWSEEAQQVLLESIRSYKPACDSVPAARVLLVGPAGAGKSSFISSVQSVLYGRVVNRVMMGSGSSSSASFTKKLQSCKVHSSRERDSESLALVLSDMVGLGETNGLTIHDTLAVIKGHVPEGHKFDICCPVVLNTPGYVERPSVAEKVHCVVFVVSGQEISSYSENMKSIFHLLREHISALGVHQVALLTHVDKVCPKIASDISWVYKSSSLKQAMFEAGALLNMPVSSIVPVKNYSEELELDPHTDTLLLKAIDHILQYVDMHLRDHSDTA